MIPRFGKPIAFLLLLLTASPVAGQEACRLPERLQAAPCDRSEESRGKPGDFDYYVLSFSWSPAFCDTSVGKRSRMQCRDNHFGWVVHGLWPQYAKARGARPPWPQYCAPVAPVPEPVLRRHLCSLPDAQLMQCQWAKHGSCSSFADAASYFAAIEKLKARFTLPEPAGNTADFIRAVLAANPDLERDQLRVIRREGYISELRFCLDRRLRRPVSCTE